MQGETENPNNRNREEDAYDELVAFILSGELRSRIFVNLASKPNYAYKIAKIDGLYPTSVIRSLKALEGMKIIECINPKSYRRKFYRLSQIGWQLKDTVFHCLYNQVSEDDKL